MTVLDQSAPYQVPPNIEFVHLVVTGENDPLPTAVSAFTHQSPTRMGLRVAGGCARMDGADKREMLSFFGGGLRGFRGFISSGGTREVTASGQLDPMVTDVPALIVANAQPGDVVAVSTLPRTDDMGLVDESRLVLCRDGHVVPNPGVHMVVVVQSHTGIPLDWDGDLGMYFDLFGNLVRHGGWRFGIIVFNGGGVTETEAMRAMAMGWPVFLIEGSGRKADELAGQVVDGSLDLSGYGFYGDVSSLPIEVVPNGDYLALQQALIRQGLVGAL